MNLIQKKKQYYFPSIYKNTQNFLSEMRFGKIYNNNCVRRVWLSIEY